MDWATLAAFALVVLLAAGSPAVVSIALALVASVLAASVTSAEAPGIAAPATAQQQWGRRQ
jgi:hypothetical protein